MPLPEFEIDIDIRQRAWEAVADLTNLARTALETARQQYCPRPFSEISLLFTNNAHIQDLNQTYRKKNKPTNVLSFPAGAEFEIPVLGDIVMAFEMIADEARNGGIPLEDHITHLLIHGYLHLQGLDHVNNDDAEFMEALEIKALADLGIANPYDRENM